MIIGITGGTGSGKSTLLHLIEEKGGLVLDCDAIYHHLLKTDISLLNSIDRCFPGTVENGMLNRKKLGAIVFNDESALQELNHITHAAVKEEILRQLAANSSLVAIDAIGLFEGELAQLCDVTIAVTAPEELRIQRIMARDGISKEYAKSRIAAQHSEEWFTTKCDYILDNSGTSEDFQTKSIAFLRNLGII